MIDLTAAGITETESKCYAELVRHSDMSPAEIAKLINETRSNAYKVLDSLTATGLAEKFEEKNKLRYRAANPQKLLELARVIQERQLAREKMLQDNVSNLTKEFYQTSSQPGIRFFQGKDSIQAVFEDMLKTKDDIYLIRSMFDDNLMGQDFYTKFKKQRAKLGIKTYMLAPDGHVDENNNIKLGAYRDPKEDKALKIIKTWLPVGAYESAVEWNVYDNKVVLISYGEEAFATVIQSKQIAESVKELFRLAKNNIRS